MKTIPVKRLADGAVFASIRAAVRAYFVDTVPSYNLLTRSYQEITYAIESGRDWHGSRYQRVYGSGTDRRKRLDDIRDLCRVGMRRTLEPMADPSDIAADLLRNLTEAKR